MRQLLISQRLNDCLDHKNKSSQRNLECEIQFLNGVSDPKTNRNQNQGNGIQKAK